MFSKGILVYGGHIENEKTAIETTLQNKFS